MDVRCLHCGDPVEQGVAGPAVKGKQLQLCVSCIVMTMRTVLDTRNAGWIRGTYDAVSAHFCWLCGASSPDCRGIEVGRELRNVRVCPTCLADRKQVALQEAGLPADWLDLPRRCGTCEHCHDGGFCYYEIPRADAQGPAKRPLTQREAQSDFGCAAHWAPRLQREKGRSNAESS